MDLGKWGRDRLRASVYAKRFKSFEIQHRAGINYDHINLLSNFDGDYILESRAIEDLVILDSNSYDFLCFSYDLGLARAPANLRKP